MKSKKFKKAKLDARQQMIADGITPYFEKKIFEKDGDYSVISFYERKKINDFRGKK